MTKPILYAFSAASLAAILAASGLVPQFSKPGLTEQVEACLKQSDYACLVELGYKYPPEMSKEIHQRQAAETLAYLGKTDRAFKLYQTLPASSHNHNIANAIVLNMLANDQAGKIDGFLDKITDTAEKIAILNGATTSLRYYRDSIKHPELLDAMKQIVTSQLEKIRQSGKTITHIEHYATLAETHPQSMLQLAKQFEDQEKGTRFAEKVKAANQRHKHKNEQIAAIKALLLNNQTDAAMAKIRKLTDNTAKPEFNASNYASFLLHRSVQKLWHESDPDFQDKFAKVIINGSKAWDDPHCQSAIRENLALLYAFSGRQDTALTQLHLYKQDEPETYHTIADKGYCSLSGYFSTSVLQMFLGDESEFKRDDYLTQFPHANIDERIDLQIAAQMQAYGMLTRANRYSTPESREKVKNFYKNVETTLLPEQAKSPISPVTIIDAKNKSFASISPREEDTHIPMFMYQAIKAGDYEQTLALIAQHLESIKGFTPKDQPEKLTLAVRNNLIGPLIRNTEIRKGFLQRAIGS